jgi:fermentation-respiration switch protein FrsA (DUF1100 family)
VRGRWRQCRIRLHERHDELVPFWTAETLQDATQQPADRMAVDKAGHNDLFAVGTDVCYAAIARCIERQGRAP